jgi:photosystem II stability/assembly factor-like uncharacterized protein
LIKFTKTLIIILLFFSSNVRSQQSWLNLGSASIQNLWKCHFTDTLNGWAIGDSGVIVHTSNGGLNWVTQDSKLKEYMVSVYFINKRLGWATSWGLNVNYFGTYLLKTTDGGNNWDTSRYPIPDTWIRNIYFLDSLTGYMGGSPAILLKTTNAGVNWFSCYVDTNTMASKFPILKFNFYTYNFGFASGGVTDIAGVIWRTTNAGLYWSAVAVASEPLNDIKIFDTSNILIIGGDLEFGASCCKSSNGGLNWSYKNLEIFGVPNAMSFRTISEAWCPLGYLKSFIRTTNGGDTWETVDTPDSTAIFDTYFVNEKVGFGVGLNGAVVKFNYGSVNINNNSITPDKYTLSQNYPNPFNLSTNIDYSIKDISEVELKVFNVLGKEVSSFNYGIKDAGKHRIMYINNNLPSGIYFYRIGVKNLRSGIISYETKKMVLIK